MSSIRRLCGLRMYFEKDKYMRARQQAQLHNENREARAMRLFILDSEK